MGSEAKHSSEGGGGIVMVKNTTIPETVAEGRERLPLLSHEEKILISHLKGGKPLTAIVVQRSYLIRGLRGMQQQIDFGLT